MTGGGIGIGYAEFAQKNGLGWEGSNLDLLDFASGMPRAEALRVYQDYLTVHLGDPLVRLDTKRNYTHGFDQTVGERVMISESSIYDVVIRDINADSEEDLWIFHGDGTIGLRMDPGGDNNDIGDIAKLSDIDLNKKGVGDFFGDQYPDVAFVTDDGLLQILDHDAGIFRREDPVFDVLVDLGPVMHMKVFDMDDDGLDDIVVLDRLGSLYIFYGDPSKTFRVQFLENAFNLKLDDLLSSEYFTGSVRYE